MIADGAKGLQLSIRSVVDLLAYHFIFHFKLSYAMRALYLITLLIPVGKQHAEQGGGEKRSDLWSVSRVSLLPPPLLCIISTGMSFRAVSGKKGGINLIFQRLFFNDSPDISRTPGWIFCCELALPLRHTEKNTNCPFFTSRWKGDHGTSLAWNWRMHRTLQALGWYNSI